jgi:hypothetical protein
VVHLRRLVERHIEKAAIKRPFSLRLNVREPSFFYFVDWLWAVAIRITAGRLDCCTLSLR